MKTGDLVRLHRNGYVEYARAVTGDGTPIWVVNNSWVQKSDNVMFIFIGIETRGLVEMCCCINDEGRAVWTRRNNFLVVA